MRFTNLRYAIFLLIPMAIASASNVFAQGQTTQADLRCLVAIIESSAIIDKMRPGTSEVAGMYYMGKVDADDPNLDLEAAIRDLLPKMSSQDVSAEDVRCGLKLSERGRAMSVLGQHLISDPTGKGSDTSGISPH